MKQPFKIDELIMTLRRVIEESKFTDYSNVMDSDDVFNALSNSIRRQILMMLNQAGKMRFMDLTRELGISDHTKVNFHLKVLKKGGLIEQDDHKYYSVSSEGQQVTGCMSKITNMSS